MGLKNHNPVFLVKNNNSGLSQTNLVKQVRFAGNRSDYQKIVNNKKKKKLSYTAITIVGVAQKKKKNCFSSV